MLCRLVVVLERRVHVYALETLEALQTLETPENPQVGLMSVKEGAS
jgi:hypothetical protein